MKIVPLLVLLASAPALAQDGHGARASAGASARDAIRILIERFHLFPSHRHRAEAFAEGAPSSRERLFHMTGDPDALVTLGDLGGTERMRVKAAVELNDVVLHAIAPDQKVSASDTRQRAAGDYQALDATGRPYQFRLGARLVW